MWGLLCWFIPFLLSWVDFGFGVGDLGEEERVCPVCGRVFRPESSDQEFCSEVCEEEYEQEELEDWLLLLDEI